MKTTRRTFMAGASALAGCAIAGIKPAQEELIPTVLSRGEFWLDIASAKIIAGPEWPEAAMDGDLFMFTARGMLFQRISGMWKMIQ